MKLSRMARVFIGVITIWPMLYILLFFAFIFSMVLWGPSSHTKEPPFSMILFFAAHLLTMLICMGLAVFYIVHAVKNTHLKQEMRIIWVIVFLMGGPVGNPIYWYLHIWKEQPEVVPQGSTANQIAP